jgi:hypothetical protein
MHGVFTRMLLHQLLEEAGGDKAEAARLHNSRRVAG